MSSPTDYETDIGRLYCLDTGNLQQVDKEPIQLSNGLAWNADETVMYFVDTLPRVVYAYDFDLTNGAIGIQYISCFMLFTVLLHEVLYSL